MQYSPNIELITKYTKMNKVWSRNKKMDLLVGTTRQITW